MKFVLILVVAFIVASVVYVLAPQPTLPVRWDSQSGLHVPDEFVFLCVERGAASGRAILATHHERQRGTVSVRTGATGSREIDIASLTLAAPGTDEQSLRECERIWNSQIDPQAQLTMSLARGDGDTVVATISRRGILNEFTYRPGETPTPLIWRAQTLQTFSASRATRFLWPLMICFWGVTLAVGLWLKGRRAVSS